MYVMSLFIQLANSISSLSKQHGQSRPQRNDNRPQTLRLKDTNMHGDVYIFLHSTAHKMHLQYVFFYIFSMYKKQNLLLIKILLSSIDGYFVEIMSIIRVFVD